MSKVRTKRRPGRPPKKLDLEIIEKLASIMCTDEEIADFLGICRKTLYTRKTTDPKLLHAMEKGKSKGRISLRRAQFKLAAAGNCTMLIWLGKQWLKQSDVVIQDEEFEIEREVRDPEGNTIVMTTDRVTITGSEHGQSKGEGSDRANCEADLETS